MSSGHSTDLDGAHAAGGFAGGDSGQTVIRVFLSSPGDVAAERERAERVARRLSGLFDGLKIECYRWDRGQLFTADRPPQEAIPDTKRFDIVIGILWSRLGVRLADSFPERQPDGQPYPSGTAFELMTALQYARASGGPPPHVFVFRKTAPVPTPVDDSDKRREAQEQVDALGGFIAEQLFDPDEGFRGFFEEFDSADAFERRFEEHMRLWLRENGKLGRERPWRREERGSPFRGLEPFEAEHREVFFGRTRDVERARERLEAAAAAGIGFLLIEGPSGVGKSSLARAGLVPRLQTPGVAPGVRRSAAFRPGDAATPAHALAEALFEPDALPELSEGDSPTPAALAALFAASGDPAAAIAPILRALDRAAEDEQRRLQSDAPPKADLVLLIDQGEELFSGDIDMALRARLGALFTALAGSGRGLVIMTLRDEATPAAIGEDGFPNLIDTGARIVLKEPGPAEIAEIVRKPAQAAGILFENRRGARDEEALDAVIIEEASAKGALPLLEFGLSELYSRAETRALAAGQSRSDDLTLTFADYEAIGRLEGAIAKAADQAFAKARAKEKAALPRLVRALVSFGAGGLALITKNLREAAPTAAARALAERLIDARILVASGAGEAREVRFAHRFAVTGWAPAREAAEQAESFLRVRDELIEAEGRWRSDGRRSKYLLTGVLLEEATNARKRYGEELSGDLQRFIRRSTVRANLLFASVSATALVALGLAGVAGFYYVEAETQRSAAVEAQLAAERNAERAENNAERAENNAAQAERSFNVAKETINDVIYEIAQGLKDVTGMSLSARRRVLESVENQVNSLLAVEPDDPEVQRIAAVMYSNFGDVYSDAGDGEAAGEAYAQALAIFDDLALDDETNPVALRDRIVSINRVADVMRRQGDINGALETYQEGLVLSRRLVELGFDPVEAQRDVSVSLQRIADLELALGDTASALSAYEEVLEALRQTALAMPEDARTRRDVSVILNRIGDVKLASGDAAGALADYRESFDLAQDLADRNPDSIEAKRDVSVSLIRIGDLELRNGQPTDALATYNQALDILRDIARLQREDVHARRDVAVILERIGDVRLEEADVRGALEAFGESQATWSELATLEPGNVDFRRGGLVPLTRIGDIRLMEGDAQAALGAFEEALRITRELMTLQPGSVTPMRDVSVTLNRVGDVRKRQGDWGGALAAYEESLALARELARTQPENIEAKRDVSVSLSKIGEVRSEQNNLDGAADAYEEVRAILQTIAELSPNSVEAQRDLSVALNRVGDVRFGLGDQAAALQAYERGLAIARDVVSKIPSSVQARRDVAVSLNKVGDVSRIAYNDLPAAAVSYREALDVYRGLAELQPNNVQAQSDVIVTLFRVSLVGDDAEAVPLLREALGVARQLEERNLLAADQLGWPEDLARRLETAETSLRMAESFSEMRAAEEAAATAFVDGDYAEAARQQNTAVALFSGMTDGAEDLPPDLDEQRMTLLISQAWYALLSGDLALAETASRAVLRRDPSNLYAKGNLGNALALQGRVDDARKLFLDNIGAQLADGRLWQEVVAEDFGLLRDAGVVDGAAGPILDDILAAMTAATAATPPLTPETPAPADDADAQTPN